MARTTTDRGYGWRHQQERKRLQPVIDAGRGVCARCGGAIPKGTKRWHLDHADDRGRYIGPSHVRCNTSAGGRKGNRIMRVRRVLRQQATTRLRW